MSQVIKQVAGVDVAAEELVVCLCNVDLEGTLRQLSSKTFSNNPKGIATLRAWVEKAADDQIPLWYVMEATGVYHEKLAYFLAESDCQVSIIMPSKISNFARTLDLKTITDKTSSQTIARFGLERKLVLWKKPAVIYKSLQQLTRERNQLVDERTLVKNQLHAENASAFPYPKSIKRMTDRITLLSKQIRQIQEEINDHVKMDPALHKKIKLACTIPGVGVLTAAAVVAETQGFNLITSKRQLVSYAGLDVVEKQSGTSVKGKPKISKRGNRHLRKAMHMPALSSLRASPRMKAVYQRLISKHNIKMKAVVAIQRKLLEMIYILWKTDLPYDPEYLQKATVDSKKLEQS